MPEDTEHREVWVTALFGAHAEEPLVQITVADGVFRQMTPDQARNLARNLFMAADASESDAFIYQLIMKKLGGTMEMASAIIKEFRDYRRELDQSA
jgi:hypothetical protein